MSSESDYSEIEQVLGHKFNNRTWLEAALTHRSSAARQSSGDYERLEFLGDAVIDLAVAELLLERYPDAHEGELSKMRAALVNTGSLAQICERLGLFRHIKLSRSESDSGGAKRPGIMADVLEATIGAIYKDAGFDAAQKCIEHILSAEVANVTPRDPKTELQELLHALGKNPPVYLLEAVEGPEHEPKFISIVEVDGAVKGRGKGPTKKASQQLAAAQALQQLHETKSEIAQNSKENL